MELVEGISRLKSLVNTSLYYSTDEYDRERLLEMQRILTLLVKTYSENLSVDEMNRYFTSDVGYVTPKVDVRAVVYNDDGELLMVQEKSDARWVLPGGWADVGYAPSEIAVKETFEEAGIAVTPVSIIKIVDKAKHNYPKSLEYVYKFFIYCKAVSFETEIGMETLSAKFVNEKEFQTSMSLSSERNTVEDIQDLFEFYHNPWEMTKFD